MNEAELRGTPSAPNTDPGPTPDRTSPVASVVAVLAAVAMLVALAVALPNSSVAGAAGPIHLDPANAERCDPIDPRSCLLPMPNDFFTVPDATTDTGRRVHLDVASMPVNTSAVPIDPTELNRNDGFSPGSPVTIYVPGVDLARTGAAPLTDIGASLAANAPIILLDAVTGERQPYWAELDSHAAADTDRILSVRPAVNFTEGHRYIVAFRHLRDGSGAEIATNPVFASYRDGVVSDSPPVEARRAHMDGVLTTLDAAGVARGDLYLAWDFTIASTRGLAERMLHIRDDAFAALGSAAPAFTVTSVQENVNDRVARRVDGTFEVPLYLDQAGVAGSSFANGPNGLPTRTGTYQASFRCTIPKVAMGDGTTPVPGRPVVYGHGLLGSENEVGAGNIADMVQEHNMTYCATRWIGMSNEDVGNAVAILQDMSHFKTLADRSQQGMLNFLFLGRLLKHADGFAHDPAFQVNGQPVFDRTTLFYDGNSQGAIMGGGLTAVAQDWQRAVLGVPGMNYSLLLARSSDFSQFLPVFYGAYPDQLEQGLILNLAQQLWDRAETNGYAQHISRDPYPGTPTHQVLMHVAFGDHQVTTYSAEVEARTIGARLRTPAVAPGRVPDVVPYWGITPVAEWPTYGSVIQIWDSGADPPPITNVPPSGATHDPHEDPRASPVAREQKSQFLQRNGQAGDVCGTGQPCTADQR